MRLKRNVILGWLNLLLGGLLLYWSIHTITTIQQASLEIQARGSPDDAGGLTILFLIFCVIPMVLLFLVSSVFFFLDSKQKWIIQTLPLGYPLASLIFLTLMSSPKLLLGLILIISISVVALKLDLKRESSQDRDNNV
ncbi:MAG: hypothetical protein AAGG51_20115 [Cyanobacteria bacterium P01_G01_bin.54]